jgi:lysophospholipid acyltransferase (LPLAT)-like uncharacterized protein
MKIKEKFKKSWKAFWREFMSWPLMQWGVATLMSLGIWVVYLTSFKKIRGGEYFRQYKRRPAIFVFWHGRSMMLSPIERKYGMRGYAISSMHRDGRMMAKLQRLFGLKPIYGSTKEGAVSVLRQGVRKLREGHMVCMSPDGPKGPRMRLKDGVMYFAKMTGAPIIPVCYSSTRPWFQNRWDKYLIALPFSRIICQVGAPIYVPPKLDVEKFETMRQTIEKIMIDQLQSLDMELGNPKIEPETRELTPSPE